MATLDAFTIAWGNSCKLKRSSTASMAANASIYLLLKMLLQLSSLLSSMRFLRVCHATPELCHGRHVDWGRRDSISWTPW